jgi:hypothetical protein
MAVSGCIDLDEATGLQLPLMAAQRAIGDTQFCGKILLRPEADRIAMRIGPIVHRCGTHHAQERITPGQAETEGRAGVSLDQLDQVIEGNTIRQHGPGWSGGGLGRFHHCHITAPVMVRRRKTGQIFSVRAGAFFS